jgi:hypothetical protein
MSLIVKLYRFKIPSNLKLPDSSNAANIDLFFCLSAHINRYFLNLRQTASLTR